MEIQKWVHYTPGSSYVFDRALKSSAPKMAQLVPKRVGENVIINTCSLLHMSIGWCIEDILTYSMVQSHSCAANRFAASQEIHRISRNPKVHYRTHKCPPPVSILCQPNPVHIPTSHLLEIKTNIIHPSKPRSPQWSSSLRFPHQDPIHTPLLTHTRHMPSPSLLKTKFMKKMHEMESYKKSYCCLWQ